MDGLGTIFAIVLAILFVGFVFRCIISLERRVAKLEMDELTRALKNNP